jgi:hypothetical protein
MFRSALQLTRTVVLTVAVPVIVAACGGGGAPPSSADAATSVGEVRQAALSTVEKGTAELLFSISFEGSSSIASGTRLRGSGSTTFARETRQSMQLDMDTVGGGILEYIADGTDLFLRGQITETMGVPPSKWLYIDLTSDSEGAQRFASVIGGDNDASLLVYYLLGAHGETRDLGVEELDGTSTRHVGVQIELDSALAEAPEAARSALQATIAEWKANGVERDFDGEAWIGADGLVRRVSYTVELSSQAGGGQMSSVVDFSNIGDVIALDTPSPDEVVALDDL